LPYDYYRSNPTSPTQQPYAAAPRAAYHPVLRGGVPVFPPHQSPQVKRKTSMATPTSPTSTTTALANAPGENRRRPMSFVRALEITDSMEMVPASNAVGGSSGVGGNGSGGVGGGGGGGGGGGVIGVDGVQVDTRSAGQRPTTPTPDRASVYDMNYEISV
jgi:uncharacterized membrane protein YgcG